MEERETAPPPLAERDADGESEAGRETLRDETVDGVIESERLFDGAERLADALGDTEEEVDAEAQRETTRKLSAPQSATYSAPSANTPRMSDEKTAAVPMPSAGVPLVDPAKVLLNADVSFMIIILAFPWSTT